MSEWIRGSRGACDRYAPTLALLDDPSVAIDPAERAAALEHLAGCALCQADQAADARIDAALSRAFGAQAGSSLRTRDLLLAIGATSEPAPHITVTPAPGAAHPIRSVVDLGAFEGGFERMSESDEANGAASATTSGATPALRQPEPARKVVAIPSLRPAPHSRPSSRALAMGFSATAAAVILVVVAATLFASRGRAPANTIAAQHASATATAQAKLAATTLGAVYTISMDSPTDGWAIGDATPLAQPSNAPAQMTAALYHYDGRQWRLAQRVPGMGATGPIGAAYLKMLLPRDGWIFDGADTLLHYDGTSWKPVSITLAGNEHVTHLNALDFASSTEGYAVAYLNGGAAGSGAIGFLRYDGQQWSVDQTAISAPDLDVAHMAINRVFALPGGDAWAIGVAFEKANTAAPIPSVGLIFQRVGGVWSIESELNQPSADTSVNPRDLYMSSPTSGWIVGESGQTVSNSEGTTTNSHALLLRYDVPQYGNRWIPVNLPIETPSMSDGLDQIVAAGPDNVWVNGSSSFSTITAGVAYYALLLHYDGVNWTQTPPSLNLTGVTSASVNSVSLTADGTLWGAGGVEKGSSEQESPAPLFTSYRDGAWSVTPFTAK